ncbi:polysaccharide deacetylase family protein [Ectopseudomonas mendocina]
MKPWQTPAALAWLQRILQERFGHALVLQAHTNGQHIDLLLPGNSRCITLALSGTTFTRSDSDLPCAQWNAAAEGYLPAIDARLPAPGAAQLPAPLISATGNGWHIGYDILGLAYWMLNRIEEIGRTDLDNHGRFPATASHAYKHDYLERPVVDEWLHVLGQVMLKTWPEIALKQHAFSMKVSHDVDSPSLYSFKSWHRIARMMVGHALKRRDLKAFLQAPWVKMTSGKQLHQHDPYNTFDWLMDVSEQHGLTSAFYFICGRTSNMDAEYRPEHPRIRALMQRMHQRGHEIGLHPSYGTYQAPALIRQEADKLRAVLAKERIDQHEIGGRMHYLRWEQPTTLQAWADAGMAYDSTLGYADRPGFRCGTCFEYPAFNSQTQQALSIRIRPLIAMECTVIDSAYLGLGNTQTAEEKFLQLKSTCRKFGGCFTTLWHNSYFANGVGLKGMYQRIMMG